MDDCCEVPNQVQAPGSSAAPNCPACGKTGKKVAMETIKSLLAPAAMRRLEAGRGYSFCVTPSCATVYFSGQNKFEWQDVRVPVFQKDPRAEVPVCYCFGYTREDLSAPDSAKSASRDIAARVKQGLCACEIRNPQGSCCLGNVAGFSLS
jgi:hypothetical protein